jgi:purine catabolism regulator
VSLTIRQLIAEPILELELVSPSTTKELGAEVRWVASSDLVDPTPFLTGGELLLTTGGSIDAEDTDAWDAYAGRLVGVPVAGLGFGTGLRHARVPPGLARAARAAGLPLFEVPYRIPFMKISHFVADAVFAQRFRDLGRANALSSRLANAVSTGAPLSDLLRQVAEEIHGSVAVVGIDGAVIASWPIHAAWHLHEDLLGSPDEDVVKVVPLDSAGVPDHLLMARSSASPHVVEAVVSSCATLVAIDLSRRLAEEATSASRMATFLDGITDWTTPTASVARAMRAAGLTPDAPTVVVAARPQPSDTATHSLRLRLAVQSVLPVVQSVRRGDTLLVLAQGGGSRAAEEVMALLAKGMATRPVVVAGPADDAEDLRVVLASARSRLAAASTPTRAPAYDLGAVVAASAGRGGRNAAARFFAPLIDHDTRFASDLLKTLRIYLAADGRPGEAAATLHIHRNTLRYRLGRITKLLGVDLTTLDGQLNCAMAFQLRDTAPR